MVDQVHTTNSKCVYPSDQPKSRERDERDAFFAYKLKSLWDFIGKHAVLTGKS